MLLYFRCLRFLLPVAIVCSMKKNRAVYRGGAEYPAVISQKEALKPLLKGTEVNRLLKKASELWIRAYK